MTSRKFIQKLIEKWPIKVLSIAAALILMTFHRMNTLETRFFTTTLQVLLNENLVPANLYPQTIRVSLRGEGTAILPIPEEDIEVFIDLQKFTAEGLYRVPVQILKKGSALGVEPLEITVEPMEISIRLEEKMSRNIPVIPLFQGTVAEDYELTSESIFPANVIAEGPRSSIESIHEFNTATIDLEGRFEDFSVIVNIINNDPLVIIHGNRMLEYRGTISRIVREVQRMERANGIGEIFEPETDTEAGREQ